MSRVDQRKRQALSDLDDLEIEARKLIGNVQNIRERILKVQTKEQFNSVVNDCNILQGISIIKLDYSEQEDT